MRPCRSSGDGLTCSTDAVELEPVGNYATACTGAVDPNYDITYVGGTTTVIPAPLTIAATSGTMTYGGAVPVISPNISGLQNGENVSVLGAGLTCATMATGRAPWGATRARARGQVTRTTHQLRDRNGGRHARGALDHGVVEQHDVRRTVPVITPIVSGLQNGENASVLGTRMTCAHRRRHLEPSRRLCQRMHGAVDANYTITYSSGDVTVNPAT